LASLSLSLLKLGYVYLNKGDFEKAEENLKKFMEMAPEALEAPNVRNIIDYLEKHKQKSSKF